MNNSLASHKFTISQASDAARVLPNTVRTWLQRNHIDLLGDRGSQAADGKGLPHYISYRGVMRLALTARLVECGIHPRSAWLSALRFTDSANTSYWEEGPASTRSDRKLGQLYPTGLTLLVVRPNKEVGRVINVDDDAHPHRLIRGTVGAAGATIVIVNDVIASVNRALGIRR